MTIVHITEWNATEADVSPMEDTEGFEHPLPNEASDEQNFTHPTGRTTSEHAGAHAGTHARAKRASLGTRHAQHNSFVSCFRGLMMTTVMDDDDDGYDGNGEMVMTRCMCVFKILQARVGGKFIRTRQDIP